MGVNKVVFAGKTIIDLTQLTVTPDTLAEGVVAINSKGEVIVGTNPTIKTWGDLSNNGHIWGVLADSTDEK